MKSPAMSPPIKDPIQNKDSTRIINQRDLILPPLLAKGPTGNIPFIDDTHFQIKHKMNIMIPQIIHVLITKILQKHILDKDEDKDDEYK